MVRLLVRAGVNRSKVCTPFEQLVCFADIPLPDGLGPSLTSLLRWLTSKELTPEKFPRVQCVIVSAKE